MIARQNRAEVLAASGDLAAARTALEGNLEEARRGEFLEDEVIARQRLARVAIRRGEWAEAETQLATADSTAKSHGLEEVRSSLLYDRGRLALGRGELDAGETALLGVPGEDRSRGSSDQVHDAEPPGAGLGRPRRPDPCGARADRGERRPGELATPRWASTSCASYAFAATAVGEYDSQSPAASVLAALATGGRAEAALTLAEQRRARTLADRLTQADALRETDASRARSTAIGPRPPPRSWPRCPTTVPRCSNTWPAPTARRPRSSW